MNAQKQWKTREVLVGSVGIGADHPIRIQSMTTTNTRDANATAAQIIQLADAGCELVRVTVQGMKEADACEQIKNILVQKRYTIPLIADIHFFPPAAMRVADFADKVRINPGNYVDKRASFKIIEYDDASYLEELNLLEEKFSPLVKRCKHLKRALRLGVNHGSLSDRIMNRYGDTPAGMVESALEFARICRKYDFHSLVFSMKSSNPQVMIAAYRLLVQKMLVLGWDYPLHLGVTEAGEGEDGRVKSAMGIGSLMLEGIGDTIRVSLTEDPVYEIDPCRRLVQLLRPYRQNNYALSQPIEKVEFSPLPPLLHRDGSVFLVINQEDLQAGDFYQQIGSQLQLGRLVKTDQCVDGILTDCQDPKLDKLRQANIAVLPLHPAIKEVQFFLSRGDVRANKQWLATRTAPTLLYFKYLENEQDVVIKAAAEMGSLLCDHLAEGICLDAPALSLGARRSLAFAILQAARMRQTKTEFISCPSCGRTLFDIQEVAKSIRERTAHLPGVKIAIMGCIVNGPGEMADADFGYVGSKPGMIDLYVGKQRVQKDIVMSEAVDRLVELIKAHGRWIEPSTCV